MKGIKSPSHQRVKTDFKKIFPLGGIFRIFLEFTLRERRLPSLSLLYNGKKGEKRFMENQQLVKYFDFFHFLKTKNRAPGFLPYVRQTKKIEKSEYDFSIF